MVTFGRSAVTGRQTNTPKPLLMVHFAHGDRVAADELSVCGQRCSLRSPVIGKLVADAGAFRKSVARRQVSWTGGERPILVADYRGGRILQLSMEGAITWEMGGFNEPRCACYTPEGNILVAEERGKRIIEVNTDKQTLWRRKFDRELGRAVKLPSGKVVALDRRNGVLEVQGLGGLGGMAEAGEVLAKDATEGGAKRGELRERALPPSLKDLGGGRREARSMAVSSRGNVLCCVEEGNLCVEIDAEGRSVWEHKIAKPVSIQALPDGLHLIAQSSPCRVVLVGGEGEVLWKLDLKSKPVDACRLADGSTAVLTNEAVIRYDATGKELWRFSGAREAKSLRGGPAPR